MGWVANELRGALAYLTRLRTNFSAPFLLLLVSAYMLVKGCLYTVVVLVQLPYYREMGVGSGQYQVYGSIANTPWAMKGLIGMLSDVLPLGGWHKRSYIVGAAAVGAASFTLLAAVPFAAEHARVCAALFCLASLELAVVDLLCEGKYAEMMVKVPESSSDLVTWVWGSYHLGSLLATAFTGPIADHFSPRAVFWVAIPLAAQIVVPTLGGAMPEEWVPRGARGLDRAKLTAQPWLFGLALAMAVAALAMAVANMFGSQLEQSITALSCSVVLCGLGFFCLPDALAKANVYMFLTQALSLSTAGASDYFYMADADCLPGGPNFSYSYYTSFTTAIAALCSIAGVALFQRVFSYWDFRPVFWVTTTIKVTASLIDIIIVKRWNLLYLGVSDKAFYLLGDAIIAQLCLTLEFMPAVVLTSKLCPKHVEATIYALLAGFQNFGQQVARTGGIAVMEIFEIKAERGPDGEACNFTGLPALLLWSHTLLPLLTIPLTWWLIPKANMRDELQGSPGQAAVQATAHQVVGAEAVGRHSIEILASNTNKFT
jgi:folate/biopterin transporter